VRDSAKMDALRQLLLAASSQDPRGLANAEQELKVLEIQPGFHAALLVITKINYIQGVP
jgi:hypothetical protein